jgi:NRAMP (natural resistance-associated macrophage protein)-like metal ion transporter
MTKLATPPETAPRLSFFTRLSAGLITGAADDDPSGIATYSQVGAKFGYATLWTIFLTMPLMIAVQVVAARIGRVSGFGLFDNLQRHYSSTLVYALTFLLIVANVINLGADIGAMGAALKLLIGGPAIVYALAFALVSMLLQVFMPFSRYSPYLKILTISLFAYVATVFVAKVPWTDVLKGTVVPKIQWTADYAMAVVAVLGTTISPYLFCWQTAQEVEEIRASDEREPLKHTPHQADDAMRRIQVDTVIGMVFSNVVAFFIILTAAVTLHAHGKPDIQSSADAAEALRPIAGRFAFWLFAAGIIGTGLLALPVLAGATAYAVAGALHRPYGLEHTPTKAKAFYGVLVAAMILGAALNMTPIDPIKALYWSAVVNGVAAVPVMVLMLMLSNNKDAMGEFCVRGWTRWLGWLATLIMAVAAIVMFATMGKPA